jgi:hypothetical protein
LDVAIRELTPTFDNPQVFALRDFINDPSCFRPRLLYRSFDYFCKATFGLRAIDGSTSEAKWRPAE